MDGTLFNLGGAQDKVFDITVCADWYEDNHAYQTVYAAKVWNNTFADEFSGSSLDTTKWAYQNGTGAEYGVAGWGNNEQQYYTPENLSVNNGELVITGQKGIIVMD